MTSHELGKKLLELENSNVLVYLPNEEVFSEVKEIEFLDTMRYYIESEKLPNIYLLPYLRKY
jgi:hypothetical protein